MQMNAVKLLSLADNHCTTVLLNLAIARTVWMPSKSFLILFLFLGTDTEQTLISTIPCFSYQNTGDDLLN